MQIAIEARDPHIWSIRAGSIDVGHIRESGGSFYVEPANASSLVEIIGLPFGSVEAATQVISELLSDTRIRPGMMREL